MPTILITGANRGIGHALTKAYLAEGWQVLAACRQPETIDLDGVEAFALDLADVSSVEKLKHEIGDRPIDVLWNNAGVYLDKNKGLGNFPWSDWERSFEINTIAPIRLAHALRDNVAASKRKVMAFTTSRLGSIELSTGGAYAYRSSKAALNMAVKGLSIELASRAVSCVLMHPGWVRTDMGGEGGDIDVETSATSMKAVVDGASPVTQDAYNGHFFNYDGTEFPW